MIFVKQKMPVDTSLITFKTISNFTNDLGEVFSEKHRPLKLYAHLINKTTLSHEKPIEKHIEGFRNFCIANRDAISNRSVSKLAKEKIIYSKRVYINMKEIFQMADAETSEVIWMHLLTISALVDPAGKAREILKEVSSKGGGGQEINFLTDIISKVEANVKPNSNPMEAVSAIMQSGIFSELVSGMGNGLQDGSLDISKLVGTVQKMVTQLSADAGDQEGGEQAMNMINTMMSSISAGANSASNDGTPQPMPDIASMLGPMMAMMGSGGGGGIPNLAGMLGGGGIPNLSEIMEGLQNDDSIEEKIKKQVEAARSSGQLE
jgi:hypothetical protein